jgi:hypothetical protein
VRTDPAGWARGAGVVGQAGRLLALAAAAAVIVN